MKLNGPQNDRDQHWSRRRDNSRDDLINAESNIYESELMRLKGENKSFKDQLNRALKELKAFQLKYPSPYSPIRNEEDDPSLWTTNPEDLNPLLEAYDSQIGELKDILAQQSLQLTQFKEQVKIITLENEELRAKQLELLKSMDGNSLSPSGPYNMELINNLNERAIKLEQENAILLDQRTLLSKALDDNNESFQKQTQELLSIKQSLELQQQEISQLSHRASQAEQDREEAAKHALACSESLGRAEQEIETLTEQLSLVKQSHKEIDAAYQELKRQIKSMSLKFDDDNNQGIRRVRAAEERVKELQSALLIKNQELESTNELIRKIRSEYQSTRQDAEGMLQVMSGMERQLNEYSAKEDQVNRLNEEGRERYEEALSIKEQAAVKEEQNKREIDRLLAERKTFLLNRQNDIDKAVELVKKAMEQQIQQYETSLDDLSHRLAESTFEAERANRESKSTRILFERLQKVYEEEKIKVEEALKKLTEELEAVTLAKETERALKIDVQEQNKELRMIIDKYRSQMENHRMQLVQMDKNKESEIQQLKNNLRDIQRELAEKARNFTRKTKDFEEYKHSHDLHIELIEQKKQEEVNLYKLKYHESAKSLSEFETNFSAQENRHQMLLDQLKEKFQTQLLQLESKLRTEYEKNKILQTKSRTLELKMDEVTEEKLRASRLLEETRDSLRMLDEENSMCKNTINELTQQLSASHNEREQSVYRAAKAIEELNVKNMTPIVSETLDRIKNSYSPSRYQMLNNDLNSSLSNAIAINALNASLSGESLRNEASPKPFPILS